MKITISGEPGSGKSTIAKLLAQKLGLKHMSSGDFMRNLAKKRGVAFMELTKQALEDPEIDKEIDSTLERWGKEQDDFVIDARLGFHFIPDSLKIFLIVDDDEAAKRIYEQKREDEKANVTLEQTKHNIKTRIEIEKQRYMKLYNLDYFDKSNYDIVYDTSGKKGEENCEELLALLREKGKI